MQKKYWFYVDTFVHISIKKNNALLYNSFTGKYFEVKDSPSIISLLKRLKSLNNVGVLSMNETTLKPVLEFVDQVRNNFMGDLIEVEHSQRKPVQTVPVITIQKGVDHLNKVDGKSAGEDILNYLRLLTLYINDACEQNCSFCSQAYQQFNCCFKGKRENRELSISTIDKVLKTTRNSLEVLILSGGNILNYSRLEDLIQLLMTSPAKKTLCINYLNLKDNFNRLNLLENLDLLEVEVPVFFPINIEEFEGVHRRIQKMRIKVHFNFVIQTDEEFEAAEQLISANVLEDFGYIPFYNGSNYDLFSENVFINRSDIESNQPSMIDIYRNEIINSNFFGKLSIASDGRIFAALTESSLGNIINDPLKEILVKELVEGKSWRKVRKNVLPCKKCTFQSICPPISNINKLIGKSNLCHIYDNT